MNAWISSGGDWHYYSGAAMLCAHHDAFWTAVIGGVRKDFDSIDGALAHIAESLGLDGISEPQGARMRGLGMDCDHIRGSTPSHCGADDASNAKP